MYDETMVCVYCINGGYKCMMKPWSVCTVLMVDTNV